VTIRYLNYSKHLEGFSFSQLRSRAEILLPQQPANYDEFGCISNEYSSAGHAWVQVLPLSANQAYKLGQTLDAEAYKIIARRHARLVKHALLRIATTIYKITYICPKQDGDHFLLALANKTEDNHA
jgi:hypothetical protein